MRVLILIMILSFINNVYAEKLSNVINLVVKNNKVLKSQKIDIENTNIDNKTSKYQRLPDLNISSVTQNFSDDRMVSFLSRTGEIPQFSNIKSENYMTLTVPLYTGGKIHSKIKITELQKNKSLLNYNIGKNNLIKNTVVMYTKILELNSLVKSISKNIESLNESKRIIQEKINAGKVIKSDKLKIDVRISKLELLQLEIKNNINILKDQLNQLCGHKINNFIEPDIKIPQDVLNKNDISNNYELENIKLLKKLNSIERKTIKSENKPQVSLFGTVGGNFDNDNDFFNNNNVGIKIKYSIFDKFIVKNNLKKNRNSKEKLELLENDKTEKKNILLKQLKLKIVELKKRIETYKLSIQSAQETLDIENSNYKSGKNTINDVLDAEYSLLDNQQNLLISKYSLLNLKLNLYDLTGNDLEDLTGLTR